MTDQDRMAQVSLATFDGYELIRHAGRLWAVVDPASVHLVSWVIHPSHLDVMRAAAAKLHTEPLSPPQPDSLELLFGMPIRTDEHATVPMLELR